MRKKLIDEVSIAEMMRMRSDGMSNRDIAAALEVSVATVYCHIGKQGRRMETTMATENSLNKAGYAMRDMTKQQEPARLPRMELAISSEKVQHKTDAGEVLKCTIAYAEGVCVLSARGETMHIPYMMMPEFTQFCFAVACRMEAKSREQGINHDQPL